MSDEIFADTYALVAIVQGNPRYAPFLQKTLVTSQMNLMEFYYIVLRNFDKEIAEKYFNQFLPLSVDITWSSIKNGMHFRLERRKQRFSYVDAVGYALALEHCTPFLTGDRQFEGLPGVRFVR